MGSSQQEPNLSFTRPRANWRRRLLWLAVIALPIPTIATLIFVPLPGDKVTVANFRAIRVGMSKSELRDILGVPRYESVDLGFVRGPTSYTVNFDATEDELRARGFKEYVRCIWISPQITITSIVDADDNVVCLYSSGGQSRDLHGILGRTTTQQLPHHGSDRLK